MADAIRVGLIDANPEVRAGRAMVLNSQPDISVVFESGEPSTAIDLAVDYLLDVLVVDARVPGSDLPSFLAKLTAALVESQNQLRVVVTSAFGSSDLALAALESGASAICAQEDGAAGFLSTVRKASGSPTVATRAYLLSLIDSSNSPVAPNPMLVAAYNRMDDGQLAVLGALLDGLSDNQIAARLELTKYRVSKFLDVLCGSLGFVTRVQLELGLIRAGF